MKTTILAGLLVATIGVMAEAVPVTFDNPTPANWDNFGYSVDLDGNNILIGTFGSSDGQTHLFDAVTGNMLQTFNDPTPTTDDRFGWSVALDGNNVLIGAPSDSTKGESVGQAHLFNATTGNLLRTFNDPTPTPGSTGSNRGDNFGYSVALDGNNVLIGAYQDSTNGEFVGQAHLFDAVTGNLLRTFNDPTVTDNDKFGISVALNGNNVLIGANGDDTNGLDVGQTHLFDAVTGNLLRTFDDPNTTTSDRFGRSVALDGNNVLIGANGDDTNGTGVGQAYLFDALSGNLLHTFDDPTVTSADQFGISVALDGNNVLIGAYFDDTNGTDVGQAHLFDAVTGNLLQTLDDPTVTSVDHFGISVTLDGNNVLIGAHWDHTFRDGAGQAHLFNLLDPSDPTADFNGDTRVDGDDLGIWGSFFGTPNPFGSPVHEFGDADEDGDIDGQDFMIWQREFGLGVALSAASANVPEPTSSLLALVAFAPLMIVRRFRSMRFAAKNSTNHIWRLRTIMS